MTIAELKRIIDEEYNKNPTRDTPVITCGGWLRFGEWVEEEPPCRDNNYESEGYWDAQEFILPLPEEAKHWR